MEVCARTPSECLTLGLSAFEMDRRAELASHCISLNLYIGTTPIARNRDRRLSVRVASWLCRRAEWSTHGPFTRHLNAHSCERTRAFVSAHLARIRKTIYPCHIFMKTDMKTVSVSQLGFAVSQRDNKRNTLAQQYAATHGILSVCQVVRPDILQCRRRERARARFADPINP